MNDIIEWLNSNQGFMSAILSIIGVIISFIAICISISSSRQQNRIALFDKRFETYKELGGYFESSKGFPKAVLKFINDGDNCMKSDNSWSPEIDSIVDKATLLFTKQLTENLNKIKHHYAEIRRIDSSIDSYFSLMNQDPEFHKIKPKFIEYLQDEMQETIDETSFKTFCDNNSIVANEPTGYGEYETVAYNFYDLNKRQSEVCQEITLLQKKILEAMRSEIRPS